MSAEAKRHNLLNCRSGLASCNPLALSTTDNATVQEALRQRNLENCKKGLAACDPSALTGPDFAVVGAAYRQRNLSKKVSSK